MRKLSKALSVSGIAGMDHTKNHVMRHIDEAIGLDVIDKLTSKQITDLIKLARYCYHAGRKDTGADVIDGGDAVWIDTIGKLIPLDILRAIGNA